MFPFCVEIFVLLNVFTFSSLALSLFCQSNAVLIHFFGCIILFRVCVCAWGGGCICAFMHRFFALLEL